MMKHKTIFRTLFEERKSTLLPNQNIAKALNWDESLLSGFIEGTQDIENQIFFRPLLVIMPVDFQVAYWQQVSRELKQVNLSSTDSQNKELEGDRPEDKVNAIAEQVGVDVEALKLLVAEMPVTLEESMNKPIINDLVSEVAWRKLETMMALCLTDKTEEQLRERDDLIRPRYLPWETFQDLLQGKRPLLHMKEVEDLKALIDYDLPDKFTIFEWAQTFLHFNQDMRSFGNSPTE